MVHQNYGQNLIVKPKALSNVLVFAKRFKGTVSQDGFGFCWLLMTCIVLGLIRGRDVLNFFRCSNDFYNAESLFLTVNASLHWLVSWRVLSPGFLASYWSAGFGTFLQVSAFASHWREDCANCTVHQRQRKITNKSPIQLVRKSL